MTTFKTWLYIGASVAACASATSLAAAQTVGNGQGGSSGSPQSLQPSQSSPPPASSSALPSSSAYAPRSAQGTISAANANAVGEIIVTAQKRAQSINSVGLTIQAATATQLSAIGISGPADLAKLVPGFSATESIYSTPVFTLRGVGLYDATFGAVPAVAVYTDQIPRNFPVMSEALDLDLDRVEVLKGPQGTLFGQSATGGAINYITAKPTPDFHSGADFSYERFGRVEGAGFVSGPITNTLSGRLAAEAIQGGSWQHSLSRPDDMNGATRKLEGRGTLDWTPIDRLKVEVSATAVQDRSDVQAPQYLGSDLDIYSASALTAADASAATRNPYSIVNNSVYAGLTTPGSPNYDGSFLARQATAVGRLNSGTSTAAGAAAILGTPVTHDNQAAEWTPGLLKESHDDYYQGTLRGDYKLTPSITLTSITAFARQTLNYAQDLDATVAQDVDVPLFGSVTTFNQEIRIAQNTRRYNWLIGGSFDDDRTNQNNYYNLEDYTGNAPLGPTGPQIATTLNTFHSRLKSYGAFANGDYYVLPRLDLTAGVRYTENDQSASYCYNDPASDTAQGAAQVFSVFNNLFTGVTQPAILPGQCFPLGDGLSGTTFGRSTLTPVQRSLDENNISWRVGANYKLDQGSLLYVTVSKGYKAGVFSAIGASTTSQYAPATQESVLVYEAGFKAPLLDHRLQFNGAVFYDDYSNKQVRGRIADPIYGLLEKMINVPKSYIWGIEGELAARPFEGLTLTASGTYLNSEVTDNFSETPDGSAVYNAQGYTGNLKGSQLPFTPHFSGNLDAQYEWSFRDGFSAFLGGNLLYQGRQNATFATPTLLANDFEISDYTTVDFRAGFGASDHKWTVTLYDRNAFNEFYTTAITSYLDTRFRFVGRPDTYGVDLKYRFQ